MRKTYSRIDCIPPEKISINVPYTLTVNIDEDSLCDKTSPKLFNVQVDYYKLKLVQYFRMRDVTITLFPEISKKGKLHYHGTITFQTNIAIGEFYIQLLKFPYAIEIDSIDDIDVWQVYCQKSEHILKALCNKYNVSYLLQITLKTKQPIIVSFDKGGSMLDEL